MCQNQFQLEEGAVKILFAINRDLLVPLTVWLGAGRVICGADGGGWFYMYRSLLEPGPSA